MTENQKSMRLNFRRLLLNLEVLSLVLLSFMLYPAVTHFSRPVFKHEIHPGRNAAYESGLQHQIPVCEDSWVFLRRSEISYELVQALEAQRLGRCGDVRRPVRKHAGYDPGFVLPDQSAAHGGNEYQTRHQLFVTTPQALPMRRIAEAHVGPVLRVMRSE